MSLRNESWSFRPTEAQRRILEGTKPLRIDRRRHRDKAAAMRFAALVEHIYRQVRENE